VNQLLPKFRAVSTDPEAKAPGADAPLAEPIPIDFSDTKPGGKRL
jgi:hypothetical protein